MFGADEGTDAVRPLGSDPMTIVRVGRRYPARTFPSLTSTSQNHRTRSNGRLNLPIPPVPERMPRSHSSDALAAVSTASAISSLPIRIGCAGTVAPARHSVLSWKE